MPSPRFLAHLAARQRLPIDPAEIYYLEAEAKTTTTQLRGSPLDHTMFESLSALLRPPLSLERLTVEPGHARYRHKRAPGRRGEPFDPYELLARFLTHIPAPRLHLVRYYGHYAHLPRARRRRVACEAAAEGEVAQGSDSPDASN